MYTTTPSIDKTEFYKNLKHIAHVLFDEAECVKTEYPNSVWFTLGGLYTDYIRETHTRRHYKGVFCGHGIRALLTYQENESVAYGTDTCDFVLSASWVDYKGDAIRPLNKEESNALLTEIYRLC